jgi:branched-chain amino acid transport system permease protein
MAMAPSSAVLARRLKALAGWPVLAAVALMFYSGQTGYQMFLLQASLCYAIGAMSIVLVTGWTGQISLAQGTLIGLGAFLMGLYGGVGNDGSHRLPFLLAALLVPATVVPLAVIIGIPALRVRGLHFALVTLGIAFALNLMVFTNRTVTGSVERLNVPRPAVVGTSLASNYRYLILLIVAAAVFGGLLYNIGRSRLGRAMKATRDSEVAASLMGINVAQVKLVSFALAGLFASFSGALYAGIVGNVYSVFFSFDVLRSLLLMVMAVIGGLTSVPGAIIGGLLYIHLPDFVGKFASPVVAQIIAGTGVIGVLVLLPDGIAGLPRQLLDTARKRRIRATPAESLGTDALYALASELEPARAGKER